MNSLSSIRDTVVNFGLAQFSNFRNSPRGVDAIVSRTSVAALLAFVAYTAFSRGVQFQKPYHTVSVKTSVIEAIAEETDTAGNITQVAIEGKPAVTSTETHRRKPWVSASVSKSSVAYTVGAVVSAVAAAVVLFKKF
jgi:hypothetical protein